MSFLSHIFLSIILVAQGFFGHAQPVAITPISTTTVSAIVSRPRVNVPATKASAVTAPVNVPATVAPAATIPAPVVTLPVTPPVPIVTTVTPPPAAPAPPPNTTLCNGTYYTACASGESFVCPASGAAYCQLPVQQQSNTETAQQALEAQEQAVLTPVVNEITELNTQSSACLSQIPATSGVVLGQEGAEDQAQAESCENITSESNVFLDEEKVIQEGGDMTATCSANILNLEKQIYQLRQKLVTEDAGEIGSGQAGPVVLGQEQQMAQKEAAQEAPLDQQVEDNLYYCQE